MSEYYEVEKANPSPISKPSKSYSHKWHYCIWFFQLPMQTALDILGHPAQKHAAYDPSTLCVQPVLHLQKVSRNQHPKSYPPPWQAGIISWEVLTCESLYLTSQTANAAFQSSDINFQIQTPDEDNEKINHMLTMRQYQRSHTLVTRAPHLLEDVLSKCHIIKTRCQLLANHLASMQYSHRRC